MPTPRPPAMMLCIISITPLKSAFPSFSNKPPVHAPNALTIPIFYQPSIYIGKYTRKTAPVINKDWLPNDGIVNTISSLYPIGHKHQAYNGGVTTPKKGVWNYYPTMMNYDHMDYMGINPVSYGTSYDIRDFYTKLANSLKSLPK